MINDLEKNRPIDQAAKESYSWLGNKYAFIKKTEIKTWKAIFIIAFVSGAISAVIWTVSLDIQSSSEAASLVPSTSCIANPAGGTFKDNTRVLIKCGDKVNSSYLQWGAAKPVKFFREIVTNYFPGKDAILRLYGTYKSGFSSKSFSISYKFKTFMYPYPYPYIYSYFETSKGLLSFLYSGNSDYKIVLPSRTELLNSLKGLLN
jgi:hypothetical protein